MGYLNLTHLTHNKHIYNYYFTKLASNKIETQHVNCCLSLKILAKNTRKKKLVQAEFY